MASHGRADPSRAGQPQLSGATDMAGSSVSARSLSNSGAAEGLGQMSSQPGLNDQESMATAVMHAFIGTSKPHAPRHPYSMQAGSIQMSSLPVGHIGSPVLDAAALGSVQRAPPVQSFVPGGTWGSLPLHSQLNAPVPMASSVFSVASEQQGLMHALAQPVAIRHANGTAGVGLSPVVQATKVISVNLIIYGCLRLNH